MEGKDFITLEFFQVLSTKNIFIYILVNVGVGMYEGALRREETIFSPLLWISIAFNIWHDMAL